MLPILSRLTLAAVFALSLSLPQSLHAQCACGGTASVYSFDPSMGMPMGSPLPFTIEGNAIYLTLKVPELADVKINKDKTISAGTTRYYVIRGLEPDKEYEFDIRVVTLNPAGIELMEVQKVVLKTGAIETLSFKPVKRLTAVEKALEEAEKEEAGETKTDEEKTEVVSNAPLRKR